MMCNNSNLKTLSNQISVAIAYKVDTGTKSNKMSLYLYTKSFSRATTEQLAAKKNKNVQLKMYKKKQYHNWACFKLN